MKGDATREARELVRAVPTRQSKLTVFRAFRLSPVEDQKLVAQAGGEGKVSKYIRKKLGFGR